MLKVNSPAGVIALNDGKEMVLEIEVEGAKQVRKVMDDAVFVFIAPPKMQDIITRLQKRGTEDPKIIQERFEKAQREIGLAYLYDYIVVSDTVENAADKIMTIIRAEHAKTIRSLPGYMKNLEEDK